MIHQNIEGAHRAYLLFMSELWQNNTRVSAEILTRQMHKPEGRVPGP